MIHGLKGFLAFALAVVITSWVTHCHAVSYQMVGGYTHPYSGRAYGDIYLESSGSTPTALQAALTTTLGQTSLSNFKCVTPGGSCSLSNYPLQYYCQSLAFDALLAKGDVCEFHFPSESISGVSIKRFSINNIATGVISGNVLTGSGGSSSVETEPFSALFASGVFAFFFSFVLSCWVVSKNIGLILSAIKRW